LTHRLSPRLVPFLKVLLFAACLLPALRLGAGEDGRNTLAGVIEDVAFLGAVVRVRVRLERAAIIVDTFNSGGDDLPARGAPIAVNFGCDDLIPLLSA